MSADGCRTDTICCYQDDSGAQVLEQIVIGLASALFLSLMALLVVTVMWKRTSVLHRANMVQKSNPRSVSRNTVESPGSAARTTATTGRVEAESTTAAATAAVVATEAGEVAPPYSEAIAACEDRTLSHEGSDRLKRCGSGREGREQRSTSIASSNGHPRPVDVAPMDQDARGHNGNASHAARRGQHVRSTSAVSLRSLRSVGSVGSFGDMPQLVAREPAPPSSVASEDIQRLRALLDNERSRRVAAENALGSAPSSRRGSGSCDPTATSNSVGTTRSRSYTAPSRAAMVSELEGYAPVASTPTSRQGTPTPSSRLDGSSGSRAVLPVTPSRRVNTPTRSYANLPSAVGTPRAPKLPYSSLHKFPSARVVEAHALEAAGNAGTWAKCVFASADSEGRDERTGGSDQAEQRRSSRGQENLPSIVIKILAHLFHCCQAEVRSLLRARVDGLQQFVGEAEVVKLGSVLANDVAGDNGGGESGEVVTAATGDVREMTADTEELLYDELRRRYRTIAGLKRKELVALSARAMSRALDAKTKEFGRMIVQQSWPLFEKVARSYLALLVECALQRPHIEFEDTAGKRDVFDADKFRELASLRETQGGRADQGLRAGVDPEEFDDADCAVNKDGSTCYIVFPAIKCSVSWPPSEASKAGVIMVSGEFQR